MSSLFKYNNDDKRCKNCQSDKVVVKSVCENYKFQNIIAICCNCGHEEIIKAHPILKDV